MNINRIFRERKATHSNLTKDIRALLLHLTRKYKLKLTHNKLPPNLGPKLNPISNAAQIQVIITSTGTNHKILTPSHLKFQKSQEFENFISKISITSSKGKE